MRVALGARLELRQGQSLVITPQLQQAIKLLQLSNLELEAFIEGELERNPLLARDDRDDTPEAAKDTEAEAGDVTHEATAAADLDARHDDVYEGASPGDRATGDAGPSEGADAGGSIDWSRAGRGGSFDAEDGDAQERHARELTLGEH